MCHFHAWNFLKLNPLKPFKKISHTTLDVNLKCMTLESQCFNCVPVASASMRTTTSPCGHGLQSSRLSRIFSHDGVASEIDWGPQQISLTSHSMANSHSVVYFVSRFSALLQNVLLRLEDTCTIMHPEH